MTWLRLLSAVCRLPSAASRFPLPVSRLPSPVSRLPPVSVAESYVKLVLAVGRHDADYVDAYYGPTQWKADADSVSAPLPEIERRAREVIVELGDIAEMPDVRRTFLRRQLQALVARVQMLQGTRFSFDDEARALYDVTPPTNTEQHFQDIVSRLDGALPGRGPVPERYVSYRSQFVIPPARLDAVFQAAIATGRARTSRHIALPPNESFVVEYVTDKPWSGYNWYQGSYHSLIQVNTSLPIYIDRAVDLACHEGYPGHHVYNALLEKTLVLERGWIELTVYPLFSPQSLIAEGSANYGIDLALPDSERNAFERDVLFPLAGLPSSRVAEYYAIQALVRELSYAGNEAARRYLDGEIDAAAAIDWLERYALMAPTAARQRLRFFDKYRSYVINYNLGQDLVRAYVERMAGPSADRRWAVFTRLLSSPMLPSSLSEPRA